MIQLKNFSVDNLYNKVDLHIKANEITCITGENGSGKTVLTKYILGLYKDYRGEILIKNEQDELELLTDDNYAKLRQSIKLIVNNPYDQFIGETVKDEITYKLEQNNIDNKTITNILETNFKDFDLEQKLMTLNRSKAQELLILSNLTLKEKVLIIDESVSNTSHEFKKSIFKMLKELQITVILITNNLDDTYYADTVYKLENKKFSLVDKCQTLPPIVHNFEQHDEVIFCQTIYENNDLIFNEKLNIISGPSGSGKSRIIKAIVGEGSNIFKVRHNYNFIGYVSQQPIEQITKTIVYDQVSNKEVSEIQINEMFNLFELPLKLLNRDIATLSTGQLVQVLIIQNVLRGTQCIVLDEVLEVVDVNKRQFIINYLIENVECVITSTHNLSMFNTVNYNLIDLGDINEK